MQGPKSRACVSDVLQISTLLEQPCSGLQRQPQINTQKLSHSGHATLPAGKRPASHTHVQGSWQVKVFKRVLRAKDLHAHDPQRNAPRALRRKKPIFPSPAQQVSRGSQAGLCCLLKGQTPNDQDEYTAAAPVDTTPPGCGGRRCRKSRGRTPGASIPQGLRLHRGSSTCLQRRRCHQAPRK